MDMTMTAQTLTDLAGAANIVAHSGGLFHYLAAMVVGLLAAPSGQAIVEGIIGKVPNFLVRAMAPFILSALTGALTSWAGKQYGITPGEAGLAATTFLGGMHWVNAQPWAADVKKALPAVDLNRLTKP